MDADDFTRFSLQYRLLALFFVVLEKVRVIPDLWLDIFECKHPVIAGRNRDEFVIGSSDRSSYS